MKRIITILLVVAVSWSAAAQPHDQKDQALYNTVAALDSTVFTAFNSRNVEGFEKYFSKELEFYHDKGGLTGYQHSVDFVKSLAAEKSSLRRELVAGSLEVYPIPGYGAMQMGSHRFIQTINGQKSEGVFRFLHIWQLKDGNWRITRVISYDH